MVPKIKFTNNITKPDWHSIILTPPVCVYVCVCEREREITVGLPPNYCLCLYSQSHASNEWEFICPHIIYIITQELWSATAGGLGETAGRSSAVQRCDELWCSSPSWFLHLDVVKLNGVEHMQTNAFVLRGDKAVDRLRARQSNTVAIVSPSLPLVTLLVFLF